MSYTTHLTKRWSQRRPTRLRSLSQFDPQLAAHPVHGGVAHLVLVRRMASTIEGGCLCGGVPYRLHVRPKQGSDRHCEDCRRASAAPYVTWCSVPSKAIEVLSGELRRVSYADRLRSFASCCGTPLFIQDEVSSEWIDVTVASLDDPKTF